MSTTGVQGSAEVQAKLWGARARDWSEVQEATLLPLFEAALRRAKVGSGTELLDVGCGSGMAATLAGSLGARVAGFDATEAFIEIARNRVPDGDFRVGDMEALPYSDASFDVVTGFNSFQYAANPEHALQEARRVARPGASVVVAIWGKPENCEAAAYLGALQPLMPPPPPGSGGPFALSADGALEALAEKAGLRPLAIEDVECVWEYQNLTTALRGMLSAGPATSAINASGERVVVDAVAGCLEPFRTSSGGYRMRNDFRYLLATR